MKNHFWTKLRCQVGIFLIGGALYNLIEILWRGYTHWSMFIVGGLCFQLIGYIQTALVKWGLFRRCLLCSAAVTAVEFFSGCLFNLKLHMNVWDYSGFPLNIMGQVCLLYSVLWGLLSIVAVPLLFFLAGDGADPPPPGEGARLTLEGQTSCKGQAPQRGERAEHTSRPNRTRR